MLYCKSTPIFPILNFAHILVQLGMQTQTRSISRDGGAIYREFSRKRYNELKARFPKLRESEIVQRIIVEWDGLSMEEKSSFKVSGEMPKAAGTPAKHRMKIGKADEGKLGTTGAKSVPEEAERSQNSLQSGSSKVLFPTVTKTIRKADNPKDYINFYKFYLAKFRMQHPNWSSNQTTIIIKLMWRKRCLGYKSKKIREAKPKTARQAFGIEQRKRGYHLTQIKQAWRHLPVESRVLWAQVGNPSMKKTDPQNVMSTMRLGMRPPQESSDNKMATEMQVSNHLNFMRHK